MNDLRRAAKRALHAIEHHGGNLPFEVYREVKDMLRDAIEADLLINPEPEPVKSSDSWVQALARAIERSDLLKRKDDE